MLARAGSGRSNEPPSLQPPSLGVGSFPLRRTECSSSFPVFPRVGIGFERTARIETPPIPQVSAKSPERATEDRSSDQACSLRPLAQYVCIEPGTLAKTEFSGLPKPSATGAFTKNMSVELRLPSQRFNAVVAGLLVQKCFRPLVEPRE